ncbi:MAG: hypothetical protein K2X57_12955 [Xanthobacteraceae bacterium]|nr:hypothetical protein [Xanthobacteraceae bacterium]
MKTLIYSASRVPVDWITLDSRNENAFSRLVWLILPVQYYIFVYPGGAVGGDGISTTLLLSLACILALLGLAVTCHLLVGAESFSRDGVRRWSISLLAVWLAANSALAVSYFLASFNEDKGGDLVVGAIQQATGTGEKLVQMGWPLLAGYLFYGIIGYAVVIALARRGNASLNAAERDRSENDDRGDDPSAITVIIIVTILMAVANWVAGPFSVFG